MKKITTALAIGTLALAACGGSDGGSGGGNADKDKILDSMLNSSDAPAGLDEGCVKDTINGLSDSDAKLLAADINSSDIPEGVSAAGQTAIVGLLDCIDFSDLDLSDLDE